MLPVEFAIDDTAELEARLQDAKQVLYLADNAGEVLFDLKLVSALGEFAAVTYVVKESPIQNDVTLSDLDYFGLAVALPRVITTGTDTSGRSSTAQSMNVWVPPPLPPVTAIRSGSTSGRVVRKSSARMEL